MLTNNEVIALAKNTFTSENILMQLALHDDELVRVAVAMNPATSKSILDILLNDKSSWVKEVIYKRSINEANIISIHPTAIIHPGASIGSNVSIGPFTIIHRNVTIGSETIIGSHCEIGHPTHNPDDSGILIIGKNSHIRSHSIFYENSSFGDNLITGHRVTIREKTKAGQNLQIGTLSDIQGHCEIGNFVRFHSNVHIGQKSKISNYVWIFPYVVLTNDPHPPSQVLMGVTIEEYVAVATMSIILPGVIIREGALVGAHSAVARDVEANTVVAGSPAKFICDTNKIKLKDGSNENAYPWRRHFHRGYLPETVLKWIEEFK